jgi:hypothetical protein
MLLASASSACIAQTGPTEEVGQAPAAESPENFFFFRSNATDFSTDSGSILAPFNTLPNVFARTYSVTQTFMVQNGDQGIVTETNSPNSFGTVQSFFQTTTASINVPSTDPLVLETSGSNPNFTILYKTLGLHRVIVNFSVTPPTIEIQSQADVCASECPGAATCTLPGNGVPICTVGIVQ